MNAFNGIPIRVSPDTPKLKLSPDVPLRDDFRAEMDAWLLARFGTTNLLNDGQVYSITEPPLFGGKGQPVLAMNPRTFAQFKAVVGAR